MRNVRENADEFQFTVPASHSKVYEPCYKNLHTMCRLNTCSIRFFCDRQLQLHQYVILFQVEYIEYTLQARAIQEKFYDQVQFNAALQQKNATSILLTVLVSL